MARMPRNVDDRLPTLFIRDDSESTGSQGLLYGISVFTGILHVKESLIKLGRVHIYVVPAITCGGVYDFQNLVEQLVGLFTHCLVVQLLCLFGHQLRFCTRIVAYAVPIVFP